MDSKTRFLYIILVIFAVVAMVVMVRLSYPPKVTQNTEPTAPQTIPDCKIGERMTDGYGRSSCTCKGRIDVRSDGLSYCIDVGS